MPEPEEEGTSPAGGPVCYPPDAVLTFDQVLLGLQISRRTAERTHLAEKLPTVQFGEHTRRYLWRLVLLYVEGLSE